MCKDPRLVQEGKGDNKGNEIGKARRSGERNEGRK
jgi:hypothetical protein